MIGGIFRLGASLVCHCVPCYLESGPLSLNISEEMEQQDEVSGFPEHPERSYCNSSPA